MENMKYVEQRIKEAREWKPRKEETAQEVLELLRGKGLTHSQAKSVLVCTKDLLDDLGVELLKNTTI